MTVVGSYVTKKESFELAEDSLGMVSSQKNQKELEIVRSTSGGAGALCIFLQGLRYVGIGCVCVYAWCQL